MPLLRSLEDVFAHIREEGKTSPEGEWIVLRFAFPTRLKEARFPTKAELDAAAPNIRCSTTPGRPAWSTAWPSRSRSITKDTHNPPNGVIVKDPSTGEPTGMLRNAYGVLKGRPGEDDRFSATTTARP